MRFFTIPEVDDILNYCVPDKFIFVRSYTTRLSFLGLITKFDL